MAALLKGAGPEKAAAATFVCMVLCDRFYHLIAGAGVFVTHTDLAHAAIDVFALLSFGIIAFQANRNYTLWIAGFQIVATLAHLARAISVEVSPMAYVIMYIAPSYFQIILLGLGIWLHQRRVKLHGNYRSWRTSSHHLPESLRQD